MTSKLNNTLLDEILNAFITAERVPSAPLFAFIAGNMKWSDDEARVYFARLYEENHGEDPLGPPAPIFPGEVY